MGTKTTSVGGGKDLVTTKDADPATLRAQIAETRNEMSGTIEELHGRLNPAVLKDQAIEQFLEATATVKAELKQHFQEAKIALKDELKEAKAAIKSEVVEEIDAVKKRFTDEVTQAKAAVREATIGKVEHMVHGAQERVRDARRSVTDTIRENPIPAALAGLGLAWLFIENRRKRSRERDDREFRRGPRQLSSGYERSEYAYDDERDDRRYRGRDDDEPGAMTRAGRRIAEGTRGAASAVSDAAHKAGDVASDVAHRARESISGAAHRVQDTASDLAQGAGNQARRIQRRSSDFYRENPLAVGVALLAVGTAVGLAIPNTDVEDEWMGRARDQVVDRAEHLAHEALEKVGDVVDQIGKDGASGNGATEPGGMPSSAV